MHHNGFNGSIHRILSIGLLALACAASAPARADQTFTGTAHIELNRSGYPTSRTTSHVTLHESEHGLPLSITTDGTLEAHFKLLFQPAHHFYIETPYGGGARVFHVQALGHNHHEYSYYEQTSHPDGFFRVSANVNKVSAHEIVVSIKYYSLRYDFFLANDYKLQATLHLQPAHSP
jgi:hypothetical protein